MARKNKKINLSPLILGLLIHAVFIFIAGLLVVFVVKEEPSINFQPTRPPEPVKMKVPKLKIKPREATKPKASQPIVTKFKRLEPFALPTTPHPFAEGMLDEINLGNFNLSTNWGDLNPLGQTTTIGSDFVGTFYDLKRQRNGNSLTLAIDSDKYYKLIRKFLKNRWKTSTWNRYYHAKTQRYTNTFMIPRMRTTKIPPLFGENKSGSWGWVILYKGQLVHKDGITFRFHGSGSLLIVRVNGNIVVSTGGDQSYFSDLWISDDPDNQDISNTAGDWITLEPGVPMNMEVLVGNFSGTYFSTKLFVEVKDEEYEEGRTHTPILPIFKTAKLSRDEIDMICKDYYYGPESITNGPIFCDHKTSIIIPSNQVQTVEQNEIHTPTNLYYSARNWTMKSGKSIEASFVIKIGPTVTLRDPQGELVSLPYENFSAQDQEFIQLARMPVFNLDLSRTTTIHKEPDQRDQFNYPKSFDHSFAAKLEQRSAGPYNFDLAANLFVLGKEATGDKYVLIARDTKIFVPNKENEQKYQTPGKTVHLFTDSISGKPHGVIYYGYLISITDKNDVLVQAKASNKWMLEHLDHILEAQDGWYLDHSLMRTYPSGIFWNVDRDKERTITKDQPNK